VLGTPATTTVTITDDDPAPRLRFTSDTYTVDEDGSTATVTVERTGDPTLAVAVDYATTDGTATAGDDYETTSGTLTFAAGQTSQEIDVPITDDSVFEDDETLELNLSNPSGGAVLGTPATTTVTVLNDDEAALLSFDRANSRVQENVGAVEVTVVRSGNVAVPATVDYAATAGTATSGADFTLDPGRLRFEAGETTKTFSLAVTNDRKPERAENILVSLTAASEGALVETPDTMRIVIAPSDQQPDAWISRAKRSGYAGDDVYNRTGRMQTRIANAKRTQVRTFFVRVYNDGNTANAFTVKGSAPRAGSRVTYLAGSKNVTRSMRSQAGWKVRLRPGKFKVVTVRVKVLRGAAFGSRKPVKVQATWTGDGTRVDTAKAVVKVVR
jgi:hypothetical protein